jgi:hypothetical protein
MDYTKEEIELLRGILRWSLQPDNFLYRTWIRVHESALQIYADELEYRINGHTQAIWGFLHATPLEDVPLYVNEIPELARWRLMIAR